jgi:hypothetical protein
MKYPKTKIEDINLAKTRGHIPLTAEARPTKLRNVPIKSPDAMASAKPFPLITNLPPVGEVSILTKTTERIAIPIPDQAIQLNFSPTSKPIAIGTKVEDAAVTGLITPIGPIAKAKYKLPIAKIPTTPAIDPINNPLRVISPGSMNA